MNVTAFPGSALLEGNTALLVREVFKELQAAGIETELVQLAGKTIHGCRACYACCKNRNGRCAFDDDFINACIAKMAQADGNMLKRKLGAAVVAVRRSGVGIMRDLGRNMAWLLPRISA